MTSKHHIGQPGSTAPANQVDDQLRPCVEAPVGPEYDAVVAAQLHLEAALGFKAGIPSRRQTAALRSTRRYRGLVAHIVEWPEVTSC